VVPESAAGVSPDVIVNPDQGDRITFLVTAAQSNGELIRMHTVIRPGGRNQPHRHPSYSEAFEVMEGTLTVQLGRQRHAVPAGERAVATPNTIHRFLNRTREQVVFITEVRPGSQSFEDGLRMMYGLSADGQATFLGFPRHPLKLAVVMSKSEVVPPGPFGLVFPLLRRIARSRAGRRMEARLLEAYCRGRRPPGSPP
jgi:quercetin dioxygenase-like cupin family protein